MEINANSSLSIDKRYKFLTLALLVISVTTIFAIELFVKRPSNLALHPWLPAIFGHSFKIFAQVHIVVCFLGALSVLNSNTKQYIGVLAKSFFWVFFISLLAELGGTTIGIPFGKYEYSNLLGAKILGHVPYLIPISWFSIAVLSYGIAWCVFKDSLKNKKLKIIGLSTLLIASWDITLDPAMSLAFNYWIWENPGGVYYGMPLINFGGWLLTSFFISAGLSFFKLENILSKVDLKKYVVMYASIISLAAIMCLFYGYIWALVLGLVVYFSIYTYCKKENLKTIKD